MFRNIHVIKDLRVNVLLFWGDVKILAQHSKWVGWWGVTPGILQECWVLLIFQCMKIRVQYKWVHACYQQILSWLSFCWRISLQCQKIIQFSHIWISSFNFYILNYSIYVTKSAIYVTLTFFWTKCWVLLIFWWEGNIGVPLRVNFYAELIFLHSLTKLMHINSW